MTQIIYNQYPINLLVDLLLKEDRSIIKNIIDEDNIVEIIYNEEDMEYILSFYKNSNIYVKNNTLYINNENVKVINGVLYL